MKNSAKILIVGPAPAIFNEAAKIAALRNLGMEIHVVSSVEAAQITRQIEKEKKIPSLEELLPRKEVYTTAVQPKSKFHK